PGRQGRGWVPPGGLDRRHGGQRPERARGEAAGRPPVPGPGRPALQHERPGGRRLRPAEPGQDPRPGPPDRHVVPRPPRPPALRPPHHLSFGERKRVCLAGLLACEPTILALDEPTANLDPRGRRRFLGLIRPLAATRLIATHDLEMALDLCDRTILLDAGRVV